MATDITPEDTTIDTGVDEAAEAAAAAALAEQKPVEATPLPSEPEPTEREKLLEGIDSVLKPVAAANEDDKAVVPAVTDEKPVDNKPADAPVEDPDKEDDKLEFKDHPRFKALREEAIAAREERKVFDTKIAEANANLVPLTNLRSYLADAGVSGDEFAEGLKIMRALKHNPLEAAALLKPHLAAIGAFTGEGELPTDLKAAVESGEISEALARDTVRQRTAATLAQREAELASQRLTQHTTQAEAQRVLAESQTAVMAWEANILKTDPDYTRKQPLVARLIQASAAKAAPRNSQEALTLVNEAYAEANRLLPKAAPLPKPATKLAPSTASSSQARTVVKTKPKTLLDGVGQVLAGLSS